MIKQKKKSALSKCNLKKRLDYNALRLLKNIPTIIARYEFDHKSASFKLYGFEKI